MVCFNSHIRRGDDLARAEQAVEDARQQAVEIEREAQFKLNKAKEVGSLVSPSLLLRLKQSSVSGTQRLVQRHRRVGGQHPPS
jgi:hypothetical protein